MSLIVQRLKPLDWYILSEAAHAVVFGERKPAEWDRIDFALVVEDEQGALGSYATCRELSHDSLYWQYGGAFPGTKGTLASIRNMSALVGWVRSNGYKRLNFLVENTNEAMLKLALRFGFRIVGIRTYNGSILLEHLLDWSKGE